MHAPTKLLIGLFLPIITGCRRPEVPPAAGDTSGPRRTASSSSTANLREVDDEGVKVRAFGAGDEVTDQGYVAKNCGKWNDPGKCDDRRRVPADLPPDLVAAVKATVAFVSEPPILQGQTYQIEPGPTVNAEHDCAEGQVPGGDEPTFALCSGLLVESNGFYYGLTAGHCINRNIHEGSFAVSGVVAWSENENSLTNIAPERVFQVKQIVGQSHHECGDATMGPDWGVVRLETTNVLAPGARPPAVPVDRLMNQFESEGRICDDGSREPEICVTTHSLGTEAMWTCSAMYMRMKNGYWATSLDVYPRGSGGAVWTEDGAKFVGVVGCTGAGVQDIIYVDDRCTVCCPTISKKSLEAAVDMTFRPDPKCHGEDVGTWLSPLDDTDQSQGDAIAVILANSKKRKDEQQLVQALSKSHPRGRP